MRSTALLLLSAAPIALAVLACEVPLTEHEGRRGRADKIINGTASSSTDDDAVALLWLGGGFCTGTLIAPNLLLTARHCVAEAGAGQAECESFGADKSPGTMTVSIGERPSSQAPVARGTQLFVEPRSTICGEDIALVLLDKDVPGVKPKQVRLTAPTLGELTTAIGYGRDENEATTGRKIRSNIPVEAVGPATRTATALGQTVSVRVPANDFMTGESVCHGDSGGPLFDAKGLVLGTTSRGTSLGCVGAPAIFSSNAAHAELIKTALKAAGHPLLPAAAQPVDAGTDSAAPVVDAAVPTPTVDAGPPSTKTPASDGGAEPASSTTESGAEGSKKSEGGTKAGSSNGKKTGDSDDDDDSKDDDDDSKDDDDDSKDDDAPKSKSAGPTNNAVESPGFVTSSACSASPRSLGLGGSAMGPFALALVLVTWRRRRTGAGA